MEEYSYHVQGSAAKPLDPFIVVPDSIGMVFSTSTDAATDDGGDNPLGVGTLLEGFIDVSPSPPLRGVDRTPNPAAGTQGQYQPARAVAPDPALVLHADSLSEGNAGELDSGKNGPHNRPDRIVIGAAETSRDPVASSDPLLLLRMPKGGSPRVRSKPQPSSEQQSRSKKQPAAAAAAAPAEASPRMLPYPDNNAEAWRDLVEEVAVSAGAASASTRPSLCSCKKLTVAAMLRVEGGDGDGGGVTQRPGRVCANRGNKARCLNMKRAAVAVVDPLYKIK